jgi:hypothetical protein
MVDLDGSNLYQYVCSRPIAFNDPEGNLSRRFTLGDLELQIDPSLHPLTPEPPQLSLGEREPLSVGRYELSTVPPEQREVSDWRRYFLDNPAVGVLTATREGARRRAYVPAHGVGVGAHSGVTIGIGLEVRHQNRGALAAALGADPALTTYLMSVPASTGTAAEAWVTAHPGPTLTEEQALSTYEFARPVYSTIARTRLTGTSGSFAANVSVRLTASEYNALDPRIEELLTDIAWNAAHMAYGRQDTIAQALHVLPWGDPVLETYEQFEQLREFVASLPETSSSGGHIQSARGRQIRLGWIEARMHELDVQLETEFNDLLNELASQ